MKKTDHFLPAAMFAALLGTATLVFALGAPPPAPHPMQASASNGPPPFEPASLENPVSPLALWAP